mgnify:CR=1 FL=1
MKKLEVKDYGLALLLGVFVVGLTPLVAGLLNFIGIFSTEILGFMTIGTAISAGLVTLGGKLLIEKYL